MESKCAGRSLGLFGLCEPSGARVRKINPRSEPFFLLSRSPSFLSSLQHLSSYQLGSLA